MGGGGSWRYFCCVVFIFFNLAKHFVICNFVAICNFKMRLKTISLNTYAIKSFKLGNVLTLSYLSQKSRVCYVICSTTISSFVYESLLSFDNSHNTTKYILVNKYYFKAVANTNNLKKV